MIDNENNLNTLLNNKNNEDFISINEKITLSPLQKFKFYGITRIIKDI